MEKAQARSAHAALKIALLAAFVVGCVLLAHEPAVRDALTQWWPAGEDTAQQGWAAGLVFTGVVAVLVAVGVPRLALWSLAGVTFGLARGLLFAEAGTLLGSYAIFCFVRWAGRDVILRKWPVLDRYGQRLGRGGWAAVCLARIMPISSLVVNATLALTPVTHREFLLASAVGFLPEGVPAVLLGAAGRKLGQGLITRSIAYILAGAVLLAVGAFLLMKYRRRPKVREALGAAGEPEGRCPQDGAAEDRPT
jgi:uncharacterized membrane protein YdjX (TVP38/TMEM64 family)